MSDEELRSWFVDQQSLDRLLLGLRALGFSAESIALVSGAASRETIYAWTAGRSLPTGWNAEQLDRLRVVVSWICQQPLLGPRSVWLVLNGWPGGLDPTGPTALQLLANRRTPDDWLLVTSALGMAIGQRKLEPLAAEAPASSEPPTADDTASTHNRQNDS